MKTITVLLAAGMLALTTTSYGSMMTCDQFTIDFTNITDAIAKATWSDPEKITVSKSGLGWDGGRAASRDGWIKTKAYALGLSWRPAYAISVRVAIHTSPSEITLKTAQKITPYAGEVYVRYSPDRIHWSSWQVIRRTETQSPEEKKHFGQYYSGEIRVPNCDRSKYGRMLSDYSELDVPWKSDEEAAVKWILERDREFFSQHIPFIGYAEFLFETEFRGGQCIQSFRADISYGIGGGHYPPKDQAVYNNRQIPWRFVPNGPGKCEGIIPVEEAAPTVKAP